MFGLCYDDNGENMELSELKGIGPKTLKLLNKMNINTVNQLLTFYPFRYEVIKRSNINELRQDDQIIIDGIIETKPSVFYIKKNLDRMTFNLNTGNKLIKVIIFNRGFLKNTLTIGTKVTAIGKHDLIHNSIIANDIKLFPIGDKTIIESIYHSISGISSKQISNIINQTLRFPYHVEEVIPDYIKEENKFLNKDLCIQVVHNPTNEKELEKVLQTLKYEELFVFMLKMNCLKSLKNKSNGLKREVNYDLILDFIKKLPYELTSDQLKSIEDIYEDLISPKRMNRLLQGDVGCGKTIVSFIAMYINYLSGYQSALMAPTEILASQHFNNIKQLLKDYDIKIELLTGKSKNKKEIIKKLENNEIDILIGTHALISDNVKYSNLGLVITDEQHRFGVNQRGSLKNKGITPDILYMSATPIPRTYALTIYGDMDISSIKTMPNGRKDITTYLKKTTEIKDVLELMYQELKLNHQVYIVAPIIEQSDKIDLKNVYEIEENMNKAFGKLYKIAVLHGKMSSQEKDTILNDFKENKIQILISTTVIEVGIDVKNATTMVIFDAFRFGLSTLHQLRGRVGRNDLQSYCVLISDKETERLHVLVDTNDGFEVSENDFRLRGSGDLFGLKQSGDMSFSLANFKTDYDLLMKAKIDTENIIKKGIDNYPYLKQVVDIENVD